MFRLYVHINMCMCTLSPCSCHTQHTHTHTPDAYYSDIIYEHKRCVRKLVSVAVVDVVDATAAQHRGIICTFHAVPLWNAFCILFTSLLTDLARNSASPNWVVVNGTLPATRRDGRKVGKGGGASSVYGFHISKTKNPSHRYSTDQFSDRVKGFDSQSLCCIEPI